MREVLSSLLGSISCLFVARKRREPTKREKVINEKSIQVLDGQEEHRLGREEEEVVEIEKCTCDSCHVCH